MSSNRSRRIQFLYLETSFPCIEDLLAASISNIKETKETFILTQIFCSLSNDIDIMEVLSTETKKELGITKQYEKLHTWRMFDINVLIKREKELLETV